jgi:hypothetical protein
LGVLALLEAINWLEINSQSVATGMALWWSWFFHQIPYFNWSSSLLWFGSVVACLWLSLHSRRHAEPIAGWLFLVLLTKPIGLACYLLSRPTPPVE